MRFTEQKCRNSMDIEEITWSKNKNKKKNWKGCCHIYIVNFLYSLFWFFYKMFLPFDLDEFGAIELELSTALLAEESSPLNSDKNAWFVCFLVNSCLIKNPNMNAIDIQATIK